jgi:DNA-binding response OmpR family regulator
MTTTRVLIANDDESLGQLLRTIFRAYDVAEASDGHRALELLEEVVPDLVVLEWEMRKRHGVLVLDELKERFPRLPVIVLAADCRATQRAVAESLHADAFITRPFSPDELLDTVERLLTRVPEA